MAKLTAQAGNEIKVTSDKVGLSTDQLQEYRFAAEKAGVEVSALDGLFFNLNKTLGDARQGFGNGRTGIELLARETGTLIDLNGTVDQQFQTITDALMKVGDEAKRASIAEQFFGGQGRELATLLNQGSAAINKYREEFRQLGGVMSGDLIKTSQEFERTQKDVFAIIKSVRNEVAGEFMPVITDFVKESKEWFKTNKDLVKQNIKATIRVLVAIFKSASEVLSIVVDFVTRLTNGFGGMEVVLKRLAALFMLILGLKIAHSFGVILMMLPKLITGFKAMGSAAAIAQAKMLLIPLAITGIVAAIALIAEDIAAFSQGRDSLFGRMINGLDNVFASLKEKFGLFADIGMSILGGILTPIRLIVNGFKSIGEMIDVIRGKTSFLQGLKNIGGNLANTFGVGGFDSARSLFGISEGAGGTPNVPTTKGASNNVTGQFEINVAGLPPEEAKKQAQQSFENIFGTMLRQTSRDTEGPLVR